MPRKTTLIQKTDYDDAVASMRPRPDAAENRLGAVVVPYRGEASMRPRPDAAENRWRSASSPAPPRSLQ